jgi:hypothetical protein
MYNYKPAKRTEILAIPQNHKETINMNEYSLKQNIFDPSNNSPPNEFLLKCGVLTKDFKSFFVLI